MEITKEEIRKALYDSAKKWVDEDGAHYESEFDVQAEAILKLIQSKSTPIAAKGERTQTK